MAWQLILRADHEKKALSLSSELSEEGGAVTNVNNLQPCLARMH